MALAIRLNGQPTHLAPGTTVEDVVVILAPDSTGCAVARNGEVVPRSCWGREVLVDGDRLEILAPAAGG